MKGGQDHGHGAFDPETLLVRRLKAHGHRTLRSSLPLMVAVQGEGVFIVIGLGGHLELLAEPGRH